MDSIIGSGCGAANIPAGSVQCIIHSAGRVLDSSIAILLAIATVAFVFNVIRYFIIESKSEAGRDAARRYIVWSIIGFVVITGIWGIYAILSNIVGIGNTGAPSRNGYDFDFGQPTCPLTNPDGTPYVGPC